MKWDWTPQPLNSRSSASTVQPLHPKHTLTPWNKFSPCHTQVSPCEQSVTLLSWPRRVHSGWQRPWPAEGHVASPWSCSHPAAWCPASVALWSSSGSCCVSWPCSPARRKLRGIKRLVSWCFKPSQPKKIISGLKETFIERYIAERTNKAERRVEEQSEKA